MTVYFESDPETLLAAAREPGRFDRDTEAAPAGRDGDRLEFDVNLDPRWDGFGPNGGYLAAVLLRAAAAALEEPLPARSLSVHYPRQSASGPGRVTVQVVRAGRTVTTASAALAIGGRVTCTALVAFVADGEGPAFCDEPMPAMPAAAALEPYAFQAGMPSFASCWDGRNAIGLPLVPGQEARWGGWLRLAEARRPDAAYLAAASDALAPSIFAKLGYGAAALPTIDLTIHFPNPVPAEVGPEDHLAVVFRTDVSGHGVAVEDGWIWTAGGTLLAKSRQLALTLMR